MSIVHSGLARRCNAASLITTLALAAALPSCAAQDDATARAGEQGSVDEVRTPSCVDHVVEGLDLSYWETRTVYDTTLRCEHRKHFDTNAIRDAGYSFVIVRTSDGLNVLDDEFRETWHRVHEAGMFRGAYQFFRPSENAVDQADLMLCQVGCLRDEARCAALLGRSTLRRARYCDTDTAPAPACLEPGDMPLVLDAETREGLSIAETVRAMRAWVNRVRAVTGRDPMVYTGAAVGELWQRTSGVDESDFATLPLWYAQYPLHIPTSGPSCALYDTNWVWPRWAIWQYHEGEPRVPGVWGSEIDHNRFAGTLDDLASFAGGWPMNSDSGRRLGHTSDPASTDAGTTDAESSTSDASTSTPDAATSDASTSDAGATDASTADASTPDAATGDAASTDAGDAGPPASDGGASAPTGLTPDGSTITTASVTLGVTAVPGAASYQFAIEYRLSGAFANYYTYSSSTPAKTFYPSARGTTYRFRVRANIGGAWGDWSSYASFDVN